MEGDFLISNTQKATISYDIISVRRFGTTTQTCRLQNEDRLEGLDSKKLRLSTTSAVRINQIILAATRVVSVVGGATSETGGGSLQTIIVDNVAS